MYLFCFLHRHLIPSFHVYMSRVAYVDQCIVFVFRYSNTLIVYYGALYKCICFDTILDTGINDVHITVLLLKTIQTIMCYC
jgi:hypothetical protein